MCGNVNVSALPLKLVSSNTLVLQNNIYWADYKVHVVAEGTACLSIAPAGKSQSARHQVTDFTTAQ